MASVDEGELLTMSNTPLAVLDLVPLSSGSTFAEALRHTTSLTQQAESFGYQRYWFAEHHMNPGVMGVSPSVAIALVAGFTKDIRLGSAGVQIGHRTPLSVVEEFGLIDALYPGRLDLGIGRSIGRPAPSPPTEAGSANRYRRRRPPATSPPPEGGPTPQRSGPTTVSCYPSGST